MSTLMQKQQGRDAARKVVLFPHQKHLLKNENQNVMRIRVNRVALLQELNVEHVLRHLLSCEVINNAEVQHIRSGRSGLEKARNLIDLLPTKNKQTDWYEHFREALRHPDTSDPGIVKKYNILVDFLDNTIIQKPRAPRMGRLNDSKALNRYPVLPGISSADSKANDVDEEFPASPPASPTEPNDILQDSSTALELAKMQLQADLVVQGHAIDTDPVGPTTQDERAVPSAPSQEQLEESLFDATQPISVLMESDGITLSQNQITHWMPVSICPMAKLPDDLLDKLNTMGTSDAQLQAQQEDTSLKRFHAVEILTVLDRRGKLPARTRLCNCSSVYDVISDVKCRTMYVKHFRYLKERFNLDLVAEIGASYYSLLSSLQTAEEPESRGYVTRLGLAIADFLSGTELYSDAELLLNMLTNYLDTYPVLDTWVNAFNAYVRLVAIRNNNLDLQGAQSALHQAWLKKEKIDVMSSFGGKLLDCTTLYCEMSRRFREQGSFTPAWGWARNALKLLDDSTPCAVAVEAFMVASRAYAARFLATQAVRLAVLAIQRAREECGTHNTLYVNALLNYLTVTQEYYHDELSVQVAKRAVELSEIIYGTQETSLHAQCRRALATALMSAERLAEPFEQEAKCSVDIMSNVVESLHPALAVCRNVYATALQISARQADSETRQIQLLRAEQQITEALKTMRGCYGDVSVKTAQVLARKGQIQAELGRWDEAEETLRRSEQLATLCLPEHSEYLRMCRAALGAFLRLNGDDYGAVTMLVESIAAADCDVYLGWVHEAYLNLAEILTSLDMNDEADRCRCALDEYLEKHPRDSNPMTWNDLEAACPSLDDFMSKFDPWLKRSLLISSITADRTEQERDRE